MPTSLNTPAATVVEVLTSQLGAAKVLTAGPAYEAARQVWNTAVHHRPAAIVRCETVADVQAAVVAATTHRLPLSVRGGGHDWAGRALREGGLVIDLRPLNQVRVQAGVATVAGGATSSQVLAATQAYGSVAAVGANSSIGFAGLSLAGGYGALTGRYGLAADNILGAEVVLADGQLVVADEAHEPDLFWALRGGGGNFGVVTSLRVRLHPLTEVFAGQIVFPWQQAHSVLRKLATSWYGLPDALTVQPLLATGPDGKLALLLLPTWCGDPAEDARIVAQLTGLGTPELVQVSRLPYVDTLAQADKLLVPGLSWLVRTVAVAQLELPIIEVLLTAMAACPSPASFMLLDPFCGAGERVPLAATAFGIRTKHIVIGIYESWNTGEATEHRTWANTTEAALKAYALPYAYPNQFGPDRPEQAAHAYGPNAARLRQVKKRYDPANVFTATSLPLASSPASQP